MPRVTRKSIRLESEAKAANVIATETTPEQPFRRSKRKSPSDSSSESSSSKSSRSSSLSPISNQFAEQLKISTPKGNNLRSARRALTDNFEFRLPGREKEFDELTSYLTDLIDSKASGSLYIGGAPGTGKTAMLLKIVNTKAFVSKLKIVFVNCTGIRSIGAIHKKICSELQLKEGNGSEKECQAAILKYLSSKHKMTLLVLDEIDQLYSLGSKQNVLYQIFEWPSIPDSKLILVGIANSLDLTDRLLVRLQSKCEFKPKVMHFSAYTKSQIIDIFKSRLEESGVSDLFPPAVIQLLAAKVSAVSGDIRRALNIGKRVVDLAEQEKKKNAKATIDITKFEALIDSDEPAVAEPKVELKDDPKINLKEVATVLNKVYGNAQMLGDDVDDSCFPLQQKILICTMLLIIKHEKNKNITLGRLHDVYKRVCKSVNVNPIEVSEFLNLCLLAETRGIMKIVKKKETRQHLVSLHWSEEEVFMALKDKQMIINILDKKNLLSLK